MKKRLVSAAVLAAALVAQAAFAGGASADARPRTHVDALNASVTGSSVALSGTATFVDVPILVSEDGSGDATVGGLGTDIDVATVSRPVGSNNLVFKWKIADQLASPAVAAPAVTFLWPLLLDETDRYHFLMAGRAGGFPSPSANPAFSLMKNDPADGGFSTVARVSGTFGNGEVSWTVPMSRLVAQTGSLVQLGSASPSGVITGVFETVYCCLVMDDFAHEEFRVPGATVKVGVAPAGTPEDAVQVSAPGTVNATTGAFNATVPKPAQPGSYVVVVEACYSADNCGRMSKTITV